MDVQSLVFTFLGGIGIFLFAVKFMGDGLQKAAGDRLRDLLDKFTTNPFMGVLTGILVTALIQSSTGTTVLTIGLVNAGFMTLRQAIGVVMGANIGTTTTAFIISINVSEYALPIIALGAFMLFFFKAPKVQNIGQVVFGIGALFYGLKLMGQGLAPLRDLPAFAEWTVTLSENPLLGVLVGTVMTVVIQSSTAAIGIIQQLYAQDAITLTAALPVLFGDNIGTTITAVIAAIGATVAARRTALTHVIFNLIGTAVVLLILPIFQRFIEYLAVTFNLNPMMQIATAHGVFNVANVIILFPFIGVLAWIVTKLIPGQDAIVEFKSKHLDARFIESSPSIALGQAQQEVLRMAEYSYDGLVNAAEYLETGEKKLAERTVQYEQAINNLDREITDYLVQVSSHSLSDQDSKKHSTLLDSLRDIERIGDHMENIVELKDYQKSNKVTMSDTAMNDLKEMFELTKETLKAAISSLEHHDVEMAKGVLEKEELIDKMERRLRKQHISRMNEGVCSGGSGIVFVDIVSNLERIGDHSVNIAEAVIGE
ncbi:Na/Pi cotransporter family protein [Alkalicoccobacillus porphyridii]|uniref:Na/Pi cotransporter family protein n=1 Tax=Alkalicoccobacillus porphyridii TaxID=2597270 RepID=A0A553ZZ94_9BACI|nr:Na/Pi cotransporter family protein [Alkalicoccobacillus porphyridii]TSB46726.1 Na/Pi cotransporter family protein [Alkalicoccobacillus porphyridii]